MQKIEFIKMHGLGNDFVIIDNRINSILITPSIINKLSDRKFGAGCDQLIIINKSIGNEDARIEIFNPGGDKAEACGNGTRCVAKLLFEENKKKSINILSDAGILNATYNNENNISVNMGKVHTKWDKIPLTKEMDTMNVPIEIKGFSSGVAVNIGNPHIVFFGDSIDEVDLNDVGPKIENHEFFPNKTNVEFIKILNENKIKMRVWERGAGITLACGSGACAAVYAGMKKNLLSNNVEVILAKGSLHIVIQNDVAIMTGPAEISFRGTIFI